MTHVYFDMRVDLPEPINGRLVFELFDDVVPKTVAAFKAKVANKNIGYQSVTPQVYPGYAAVFDVRRIDGFKSENFEKKHDRRGILSMAQDPYHPGYYFSTFSITFKPMDWVDGTHVVFGVLVEGQDILDQIEKNGNQNNTHIVECGEL